MPVGGVGAGRALRRPLGLLLLALGAAVCAITGCGSSSVALLAEGSTSGRLGGLGRRATGARCRGHVGRSLGAGSRRLLDLALLVADLDFAALVRGRVAELLLLAVGAGESLGF